MTDRHLARALFLALLAFAPPRLAPAQAADLIVTTARVYTVDENRPIVEAMARREVRVVTTGPRRAVPNHPVVQTRIDGRADFVVLDQDIMRVLPELILGTNVLATCPGGRAVFQKPVQ